MSDLDRLIEAVEDGSFHKLPYFGMTLATACYPRDEHGRMLADNGGWSDGKVVAAYHGSLDAALALHNALLPSDWIAEVDTTGFALVYQDDMEVTNNAMALLPGCPARAWLLAILRAYRQRRGSGE